MEIFSSFIPSGQRNNQTPTAPMEEGSQSQVSCTLQTMVLFSPLYHADKWHKGNLGAKAMAMCLIFFFEWLLVSTFSGFVIFYSAGGIPPTFAYCARNYENRAAIECSRGIFAVVVPAISLVFTLLIVGLSSREYETYKKLTKTPKQ